MKTIPHLKPIEEVPKIVNKILLFETATKQIKALKVLTCQLIGSKRDIQVLVNGNRGFNQAELDGEKIDLLKVIDDYSICIESIDKLIADLKMKRKLQGDK